MRTTKDEKSNVDDCSEVRFEKPVEYLIKFD